MSISSFQDHNKSCEKLLLMVSNDAELLKEEINKMYGISLPKKHHYFVEINDFDYEYEYDFSFNDNINKKIKYYDEL